MKFSRKKDISKVVGGSWVIVNQKGSFLQLNEVAGFIWENLEKPIEFKALLSKITKEYDVEEKTAKKDLEEFLKEYQKDDLLEIHP